MGLGATGGIVTAVAPPVEAAKPSLGLEYTYARRAATYDHEKQDVVHIWEVAGSKEFAQHVINGNQIFLTYRQVTKAVVLIVLDLSDPGAVIPSALQWLQLVKGKLARTYSLFERKKLQLPEQLRNRQRTKVFSQHEDKELVDCCGVSLVLVATNWDQFRNVAEAEQQRVMARTLRWLAHINAAHLLYVGGLHLERMTGSQGVTKADQHQQQQLLDNFSRLLCHLTFTGMDCRM
eukprot:gene8097-8290_t